VIQRLVFAAVHESVPGRLRNFSHLPKSVWSLGYCRLAFLTLSSSHFDPKLPFTARGGGGLGGGILVRSCDDMAGFLRPVTSVEVKVLSIALHAIAPVLSEDQAETSGRTK